MVASMVLGSMVELAVCAATKLAKSAMATVDLTNILILTDGGFGRVSEELTATQLMISSGRR